MLNKTHIAITLFFVLLFLPIVNYKVSFIIVALIATMIPDIDTKFSSTGKRFIFRPIQYFLKHRDILHSFTFALILTLFFVLFFPILAFGFFLGYSSHLVADSFTIWGIKPLYPHKVIFKGNIKTGGKSEAIVFGIFLILDLTLVFTFIFTFFSSVI